MAELVWFIESWRLLISRVNWPIFAFRIYISFWRVLDLTRVVSIWSWYCSICRWSSWICLFLASISSWTDASETLEKAKAVTRVRLNIARKSPFVWFLLTGISIQEAGNLGIFLCTFLLVRIKKWGILELMTYLRRNIFQNLVSLLLLLSFF